MGYHRNKNKGCKAPSMESYISSQLARQNCFQEVITCCRLRYTHRRKKDSRLDPENPSSKWFTDALVTAKILQDDGYENLPEGVIIDPPAWVPTLEEEEVNIIIKPIWEGG